MKTLTTCKPFGDLWSLFDEGNRFFCNLARSDDEHGTTTWKPAVDIHEDTEAIRIQTELPGLKKSDVTINVSDGVLTISGERKFENEQKKDNTCHFERSYGTFARSFSLPRTVDPDRIDARMKDGLLQVSIAKREDGKPKQIEIQ